MLCYESMEVIEEILQITVSNKMKVIVQRIVPNTIHFSWSKRTTGLLTDVRQSRLPASIGNISTQGVEQPKPDYTFVRID